MDRFEIDPADYTTITDADPEALAWIRGNGQEAPLAGNRFDREDALAFVESLYAAGATRVVVHVPAPGGSALPMELRGVAYDSELVAEVRRRVGEGVIDLQLG